MKETKKNISLRQAFGEYIVRLGKYRKDFVVLDADVAGGTCTNLFRDAFPERFIQCGIAEQNMMSLSAGLSTTGVIPIVTCYAVFVSMRAIEQARNSICYPQFNVKIVASHPGLDVGPDGPTHQAIEDIAIYRAIPGIKVLSPADPIQVEQAFDAILNIEGPVYMRTGRSPVPYIYDESYKFHLGRGDILKKGKDLTIIATGVMVSRSLEAAKTLSQSGIDAEVINISTIKPIDEMLIVKSAKKTKLIITAEDHNIYGGLGSAVSEVVTKHYPVRVERLGIMDQFAESGEPEELIKKYGLDSRGIVSFAKKAVRRNK